MNNARHSLDQIVQAGHRLCSIPECGKKHDSKGFCKMHYARVLRHGDPMAGRTPEGEPEQFYQDTVLQYNGADCLIWPYNRNSKGYGQISRDSKPEQVHRRVCEEIHGPPPTHEHEAAHNCGKGHLGCVTKGHLSWKTPKENQADRLAHGTHGRGERNTAAKLTESEAKEIMALKGQLPQRKIAVKYGISQSTVSKIQLGKRWNWLDRARSNQLRSERGVL